ncbi:hypothetical protein ACSBR2_012602 [Camellia fascicularis]
MLQMPRATIEVKELRVDISKGGGSKPTLFVKLYLLPIVVHLGDPRVSYDQSSNFNHGGYTSTSHVSSALMEKTSAPFYCEELTLSSEFGHDREAGVVIKNVDITSGEVTLNLNEELFLKTKGSSDAFSHAAEVVESSVESSPAKKPQKKQATLLSVTKYASIIPEKVLSAPYLQSTPTPKMQEAGPHSLRSKGLCLVSISCTTGVASSNGADIWAPIKTTSPKFA